VEKELHILILEDVATDAEMIERELQKGGIKFTSKRVETEGDFLSELKNFKPDLILADYKLPQFDGFSALSIVKEQCPDVPFILISGTLGEEEAVEALKAGTTDYILKQKLSRLVPAVKRALREFEDRAESKRGKEALQKSEEKFRKLAETASIAIFLYKVDKFLYVNPVAMEMSGYTEEELLRMSFMDIVHPDFRDLVKERSSARLRGENVPSQYEIKFRLKNGEECWVIVTGGAFLTEEGFLGIGTATDITDRKKAEEKILDSEKRFRSLVENSPMGIWQEDADQNAVYVNKAMLKMLEVENTEEIYGKKWQSLFTKESLEKVSAENEKRKKGITSNYELEISGKHGEKCIVTIYGAPLLSIDGKFQGTIAMFFDITERKKMEEEIKNKVKELEDFYRMAVGRETRMIELKEEIEKLKKELEKYKK